MRIAQEAAKFDKIFAMTQSPEAMKDAIEALGIENPDKYLPQAPTPSPAPLGEGQPSEMPMGQMPLEDLGVQPPM